MAGLFAFTDQHCLWEDSDAELIVYKLYLTHATTIFASFPVIADHVEEGPGGGKSSSLRGQPS